MVTHDELVNVLKLSEENAARLFEAIATYDDVPDVLELASNMLGGYGIDGLTHPGRPTVGILEYANVGDSYRPTLAFDPETVDFLVTSWGAFLETWEEDNGGCCSKCGAWMGEEQRCETCDAHDHEDDEDEPDVPDDDDVWTDDFRTFYVHGTRGRIAFVVGEDEEWEDVFAAFCEAERHWPNVWRVDDHGGIELACLTR